MNLVLSFVHPSKPARTAGPFQAIRLDGETVREEGMERALVAQHREHQWEVEGERYFRLDCTSRVRIHFERPKQGALSRAFGPYERFSAIDGIAYTDDRVFAFVDPKVGDWFCYNDGQHWPVMVVSDATQGGRANLLASLIALAPVVAGVIGLWQGARLVYLGRATAIRARLHALLASFDAAGLSAITWEAHADPAAREAELLRQYEAASLSLGQARAIRGARLISLA